jgi:hypothetical protein
MQKGDRFAAREGNGDTNSVSFVGLDRAASTRAYALRGRVLCLCHVALEQTATRPWLHCVTGGACMEVSWRHWNGNGKSAWDTAVSMMIRTTRTHLAACPQGGPELVRRVEREREGLRARACRLGREERKIEMWNDRRRLCFRSGPAALSVWLSTELL